MILSDRSMYMDPHQSIDLPLFHPTYNKAFVELKVGYEKEAYLHYIYC
jgi:hypothetical protein